MNFHIVTLFPDMITQAAQTSILGRAIKNGYIKLNMTYIREFSTNTRMRVDDYPYGGGAGMVMEAEPVFRAVAKAKEAAGQNARVIYLTPQAKVLDQTRVEELAQEEDLILLCGHYEGIDERVLEEVVTDYISIGDYVLTGGELGALVLIDAVSRFVPGVLHNEESSQFESLQDNLLEYPHYTRPEIWHEKRVPEVLLSGDHKKVEEWRHAAALERTARRRPDLLERSRQVYTASFGSGDVLRIAGELSGAVSRYGIVLDYNRAKLRKQHRRFSGKDFLLLVTDLQTGFAEMLQEVTRHMKGVQTPAVLVTAGTGMPEQAVVRPVLEAAGLSLEAVFALPENYGSEELERTALKIRKCVRNCS